jgi:hypothetical protein
LYLQIGEEPATYKEAAQHEPWRRAMQEEMDSILDNGTWRLESLPDGHRPIGLRWVFKLKKNSVGEVIKHKARLVAKGYVQQQGVYYEEVFAPVARIESVPLLLALAAQEGWRSTTWTSSLLFSTTSCRRRCTFVNRKVSSSTAKSTRSCGLSRPSTA